MPRRILSVVVGLLGTLSLVAPASAIQVDVPGLGLTEFVLLAERRIAMEGGPVNITGNIGVNQPKSVTGLNEQIHVGQFNQINGLALGDRVFTGNPASFVAEVNANVVTGAGIVGSTTSPSTVTFPFIPDLGALTGVSSLDFSCVTGATNITVPNNGALVLAPGCYGSLVVGDNATLTLQPSGTFTFNRVDTGIGSTLISSGGTSSVNVKGNFKSGAGSLVQGIILRTPSSVGEAISIGNGSTFDATGFAPFGTVHIRQGSEFTGEIVGRLITVQPTRNVTPQPQGCGCFEEATENATGSQVTLSDGINLSQATEFFLGPDCNCPGNASCVSVSAVPPQTDTTVVLDTSGQTGTFKVIAVFPSGTYCSADTVTLP